MTKSYVTDSLRSIKRTFSRFVSIIAIVAMGSGLFCGLNAVGPDMKETANEYYHEYNLMDIRLQSYLGLYEADLEAVRKIEGVKAVQGAKFVDGYVQADLAAVLQDPVIRSMSRPQVEKAVEQAKRNMQKAAADLDFMAAAKYRDEMWALQQYLKVWKS